MIAQAFGYPVMWRIMIIPFIIAMLILLVFRTKITQVEANFGIE